ncbi:PREDICTED: speckle-type POZ protein-like [Rhagoletis zephyria]|uniref:speckle-type POZ protein-like n=1 Tax=Rhagoletis zephyria TaxID=28612 RepID=UPI0008113FB3|nr:PREDICTED: speckle-type POZ protein-like [Rhagoletis zephyria]
MAKTPVDALHRQQMQSLLESGELSDVTLVVVEGSPEQKKEFKVHRSLLSAFSPVFSAMFSHPDTKEALEKRVIIEDVSANAMQHLLAFIYTGELKFDEKEKEKSLLEFLVAIDKYQVHVIKNECESRLFGLVTIDSVCAILQTADLHSAPTLKERCFDFIAKNSDQVVSCNSESAWAQFEAAARPELLKDIFYRMAAKVKKESKRCNHCKNKLTFYCSYC